MGGVYHNLYLVHNSDLVDIFRPFGEFDEGLVSPDWRTSARNSQRNSVKGLDNNTPPPHLVRGAFILYHIWVDLSTGTLRFGVLIFLKISSYHMDLSK